MSVLSSSLLYKRRYSNRKFCMFVPMTNQIDGRFLALVRGTKMRTLPFSMVFFRGGVCAAAVGFSCEIGFLSCWKHGTIHAAKALSISIAFLLLPTEHFQLYLTPEACASNTTIIIFVGRILIPWWSNENVRESAKREEEKYVSQVCAVVIFPFRTKAGRTQTLTENRLWNIFWPSKIAPTSKKFYYLRFKNKFTLAPAKLFPSWPGLV